MPASSSSSAHRATLPPSIPHSSSSRRLTTYHHDRCLAPSIPPAGTTLPPPLPRAATRSPYAHAHPDVAARSTPPSPPDQSTATTTTNPPQQHPLDCEHHPRTALPTIDKVDSKPKTIAAAVKSRAHSRLASFGRIRSYRAHQPAERDTSVTEPLHTTEPPPLRHTPSLTSSEPSTSSFYSSETTLSDEKYQDSKSFEESRQSFARDTKPTAFVTEQRGKSEDFACDPTEQYHRLIESRSRMMHQTSSRLLRMTEDDRPFTRVSNTFPCACAPINPGVAVPVVARV
jgi:hypothetical protein